MDAVNICYLLLMHICLLVRVRRGAAPVAVPVSRDDGRRGRQGGRTPARVRLVQRNPDHRRDAGAAARLPPPPGPRLRRAVVLAAAARGRTHGMIASVVGIFLTADGPELG